MKIFEVLRKDHDIQRALLNTLVETSGESQERQRIYDVVKNELKIHEDAEERFFYNPLIEIYMTQ